MSEYNKVVGSVVEMDETYVGGKEMNKYKNKKSLTVFIDKAPIVGMKQRNIKIIANIENNTTKKHS